MTSGLTDLWLVKPIVIKSEFIFEQKSVFVLYLSNYAKQISKV